MAREASGAPRGRPPKPTALKVLHGTFRHDPQRRNTREPMPSGTITAPESMSAPARREWDLLAPVLIRSHMITPADVLVLAEFCELVIVVRLARVQVMRALTGQIDILPGQAHPMAAYGRALVAFGNLAGRLGLTPADRSRLQVAQPQDFDDLLS